MKRQKKVFDLNHTERLIPFTAAQKNEMVNEITSSEQPKSLNAQNLLSITHTQAGNHTKLQQIITCHDHVMLNVQSI